MSEMTAAPKIVVVTILYRLNPNILLCQALYPKIAENNWTEIATNSNSVTPKLAK